MTSLKELVHLSRLCLYCMSLRPGAHSVELLGSPGMGGMFNVILKLCFFVLEELTLL